MMPANKSKNTRSPGALRGMPGAKASLIALALGLMTLTAGATQVEPVESGSGAENARNTAQLTVAGISGNINLRSFSLGNERAETAVGAPTAKFAPKLLTIVKGTDANTPRLFNFAATGRNLATVTLVSAAAGISQAVTYTFSNASILAHRVSDRGRPTDGQPLEEVTFTYSRVQISAGSPVVTSCFDFVQNASC